MQLANQEALRFNHEYIGTEHILLGLVAEGSGVAANVLKNLDIDLPRIRREVERVVQPGPDMIVLARLPWGPHTRQVLEESINEAKSLKHNYVGTEHLLLGLLREEEGVAAQILFNLGLRLRDVREEVLTLLGGSSFQDASQWEEGQREQLSSEVRLQDLPAEDFPADIRQALKELDIQIELLNQGKEEAVNALDWERAAHLFDQAQRSKRTKRTLFLEWIHKHLPDPSWLTANTGTVAAIASVIDQERRWEDLPILADALEEAGCTDQEMLQHCRQPGEHLRCCWVVAMLLARI